MSPPRLVVAAVPVTSVQAHRVYETTVAGAVLRRRDTVLRRARDNWVRGFGVRTLTLRSFAVSLNVTMCAK